MQLQNAFIPLQQSTTVGTFADKIGALRATLSGADDETLLISKNGTPSIVTADSDAIAYSRTPQVIHLPGGLNYPLGLQATVRRPLTLFLVSHMA